MNLESIWKENKVMKLIDKDAVLVEIERLLDLHSSKHDIDEAGVVLLQLRENVENLEVKEVDLETEIERVRKHHYVNDDFDKIEIDGKTITNIAKHFFELGLRASLTEEEYKGNVKGSYTTTTEFKT